MGLTTSLVKITLIANRVFFKTLPRSVKMSFMTKGHGQGVLKRKKLLTPSICASGKNVRVVLIYKGFNES